MPCRAKAVQVLGGGVNGGENLGQRDGVRFGQL